MPEKIAIPDGAREVAERFCGEVDTVVEISNRRGSAVWRLEGPVGRAAVKVGRGEGARITGREAAVLRALCTPPETVESAVDDDDVAWLVSPWHTGLSSWDALREVREGAAPTRAHLTLLTDACVAVQGLHDRGWVHGDLQPAHFIHGPDGVRLIDLSWAWGRVLAPSPIFRGGQVHLLAPELAASIEAGRLPVAPNPSQEVHTLAASLWWALTGFPPLDYESQDVDAARMSGSELRHVIATRRLPLRESSVWPAVLNVLRTVLTASPSHRPAPGRLAELLEWAVSSSPLAPIPGR